MVLVSLQHDAHCNARGAACMHAAVGEEKGGWEGGTGRIPLSITSRSQVRRCLIYADPPDQHRPPQHLSQYLEVDT